MDSHFSGDMLLPSHFTDEDTEPGFGHFATSPCCCVLPHSTPVLYQ